MDLLRHLLFLPPAASDVAEGVDMLHAFVITATMIVSAYVFAMTAYFTVRYRRRSPGEATQPLEATFQGEIFIASGTLAVFLLWWVIGFRQYIGLMSPPPDALTVYVTAKQWMWKYSYPGGVDADDTLTVPVGRPVRLVMTSRDVIHSFYVPAFRIKQDVIPGRYVVAWFRAVAPGTYPAFCAELCGVNHSRMLGQVQVLAASAYDEWLQSRTENAASRASLVDYGRAVVEKRECVSCHTLDGQPHIGPSFARLYMSYVKLADGRRVLADESYLTRSMMEPLADVVDGYRPVMPTYMGLLSETEAAAIIELIRSLRTTPLRSGVDLPLLGFTVLDAGANAPTPIDLAHEKEPSP